MRRLGLRSKDPFDRPLIFGNHLNRVEDRKALLWGLELANALASTRAFAAYAGDEFWPGASSDGARRAQGFGVSMEDHMRAARNCSITVRNLPHGAGASSASSIPELRVRGVRALYVADASVMPVITRGKHARRPP